MERLNISRARSLAWAFLATAVIVCAVSASSASAALVADYRFDNSLASSVGTAPPLTEVGASGASYQTETVNGSSDQVRVFPAGAGLSLPTSGLIAPSVYTIEITFRFDETTTWERVFDASSAQSDNGLYVKNNKLTYFDSHDTGGADHFGTSTINPGEYLTVAISRSADGTITVYRDGVPEITYADTSSTGVFQSPNFPARFFIDDEVVGDENSPGAVARIRVFDNDTPVAPPPAGVNGTVTRVHCNYLVATGVNTCYAQVADLKPGSTKRPTGSVRFSSANGGSFQFGNVCALVPTPASPNVSSCSVPYISPQSTFPKVSAAYQGSAEHAPSIGATTFYILGVRGLGINLGADPNLGYRTSNPMTIGCAAGTAKKSALAEISLTGNFECIVGMIGAYEAAKNKAVGKPCDGPLKSYSDLKDCNPAYYEALEKWEAEEAKTTANLKELIEKRQEKFEELKDIIEDYNKSAKDIINNAKSLSVPVVVPAAKKRRSKSIKLGSARARVKAGRQKTIRLKLTRSAKPIVTFVRRMNKALPALSMPLKLTLKTTVSTRRSKKAKPKRKVIKRVVTFRVAP